MTADLRTQLRPRLDPPRRGERALAWLAGAAHLVVCVGPASFPDASLVVAQGRVVVCPDDRLTALPPAPAGPSASGPGLRHA